MRISRPIVARPRHQYEVSEVFGEKPPKKGASSYVSRYAAVRDTIGVPHIDLIRSTSRIHSLSGRTERYFPKRHTFGSRRESEWSKPPRKRSLSSVATPENSGSNLIFENLCCRLYLGSVRPLSVVGAFFRAHAMHAM